MTKNTELKVIPKATVAHDCTGYNCTFCEWMNPALFEME